MGIISGMVSGIKKTISTGNQKLHSITYQETYSERESRIREEYRQQLRLGSRNLPLLGQKRKR